jgi:uncharacterized protein YjbI with pentapeptide repeats
MAEGESLRVRTGEPYEMVAGYLDSDQAPVRLMALYALERLANDNPPHRQIIVNIICAYLRMPFPVAPTRSKVIWHEERHVRMTAQRLLYTHLRPDAALPWTAITLNLAGATLFDFSLAGCGLTAANFGAANFIGATSFRQVRVIGPALFQGATFSGSVNFNLAILSGHADFQRAVFSNICFFNRAILAYTADFGGALFPGGASFENVDFIGPASFREASFSDDANFHRAVFSSDANFADVIFCRKALYQDTTFAGDTLFEESAFNDVGNFREARFGGDVRLQDATVADTGRSHVFPPNWRIEPANGSAGRLVPDPDGRP